MAPGVYRVPPSPPTWEQRLLASVLAGPPGTVASHRSAARLHRLRGCRDEVIEVTCRRWRRSREFPILVHESSDHTPRETTIVDGIPVTDLARTIIDLGAVLHEVPLGRVLDEARRRGQVDLDDVERRLRDRSVQGRAGIVRVRDLLAERRGRPLTSTGFEELLLRIIEEFGLPRPELQWRVTAPGFIAFLDFAYPSHHLALEADSEEYHLDLHAFRHDRTRQNRLSLLGWSFLRYTPHHLRRERRNVAAEIASALGTSLLPPPPTR